MFEPQPLTNNAVSSVLDFSAFQETRTSLTGKTVIVGSVTYTFFLDVFPESVDASTLLDTRDIAAALCDAINADATARGVTFSAALIPSANPQAEAYVSGSIVTVVSRTGAPVVIGGDVGVTPTPPAGGSSVKPDVFGYYVSSADTDEFFVTNAVTPTVTSFGVDNMSEDTDLYIKRTGDIQFLIISPRTGRNFSGSTDAYQYSSPPGTFIPFQTQLRFN
jgi:hypothetical protein